MYIHFSMIVECFCHIQEDGNKKNIEMLKSHCWPIRMRLHNSGQLEGMIGTQDDIRCFFLTCEIS
jgi:hypothetical protein